MPPAQAAQPGRTGVARRSPTGIAFRMPVRTFQTLRFLRGWFSGRPSLDEYEHVVDRGDREIPVSVLSPKGVSRPLPGWVVLHGVSRPGRFHPTLLRFARALASSGTVVVVPQVPEWKALKLAPEHTKPTVRAAISALDRNPNVRDGSYGLIGFSFGCPQAMIAAADDEVAPRLSEVVGFGGYCDLTSTVRFQMTGVHRWANEKLCLRPDPYGRWIIGGNHITSVPEFADATDVAEALLQLAIEAGERRILAWDPSYDPLILRLRRTLSEERARLFDLFAPTSDAEVDFTRADEVALKIGRVAAACSPLLDPAPSLPGVRAIVRLIHGKQDHLIPFTETLRLSSRFPSETPVDTTITALFTHSDQEGRLSSIRREVREGGRLYGALRRVLGSVR